MNVVGVVSMVVVMVGFATPSHSGTYSNEIQQLSVNIADRIVRSGVRTVAVADFTDLQGNITELGRFLAEHFSVALAGAGRAIEVIDRTHIKTLLREHKLSETLDTTTAKQLWKIAGVEALVTGTLTPFGDTVEISIKVLDTGTAKIIDARTESLAKTKTIQELLERGITTGEGTTNKGTTTIPPAKSQQSVNKKGFTFSNPECKRATENVTCSVLITSNGENRYLTIYGDGFGGFYGRSKLIDNLGNEHTTKWVKIGDQRDNNDVRNTFPGDIPTKIEFGFEEVSTQATMAAIIIGCHYENDKFSVQLPNLPLSQ